MRDKQMINDLIEIFDEEYGKRNLITPHNTADKLTAKGYRKADPVAEEIDDLKRYIRLNEDIAIKCKQENGKQNEEYWKGKISAFRQIRAYIDAEKSVLSRSGNNEAHTIF